MKRRILLVVLAVACSSWAEVKLGNMAGLELKAHVNGKPAAPTAGTKLSTGEAGVTIACDFTSAGHDAAWVEFPCELGACGEVVLDRTLSDSKQKVFVILTDSLGESHLFNFCAGASGRAKVTARILAENKAVGEYFAFRWGGDDNQKIDWPVKKVALGVNDQPDTFVGKASVTFHSFDCK